jgi:hypothetical protein
VTFVIVDFAKKKYKMILCDNLILFVVFSTTLFASVFAQKGKIEFPYEFQMFENFDLTSKVFLEEQKLVQKLRDIQSTLKQNRDEIKVICFSNLQKFKN